MPRPPAAKIKKQKTMLDNRVSYEKPEIPNTSDAIIDDAPIPDIPQPSTTRSLNKFKNDELEVATERAPLSDKKAAHLVRLQQKNADTFPIRKELQEIRENLVSQKFKTLRQARTNKAKEEQPDGDDPFNSDDDIARVDILEDNVTKGHQIILDQIAVKYWIIL
uniref:Uncharacterized protein n=1 Tax=Panagrolaimus sp. PS1159 TaxID=55785 RepID=A0AC35EV41_9BILA